MFVSELIKDLQKLSEIFVDLPAVYRDAYDDHDYDINAIYYDLEQGKLVLSGG